MSPLDLLRDCLYRIVFVLEEADQSVREQALADLEADLAGALAALEERPSA